MSVGTRQPPSKIDHDDQADLNLPDVEHPIDPPDDDNFDDGRWDDEPIRWITVASFWSVDQAHLARLRLEAQDIPCTLDNEHLIAMNWFFANAVGGVRVCVPAELAARAREILELPPLTEPLDDDVEADAALLSCPRCGRTDVYRARFSRRMIFLSLLLLGIPLPFMLRRWRCARCGMEWIPQRGFDVKPRGTPQD